MRWISRHKLIAGLAVLGFAAGGGGAYAATQSGNNPQGAFLNDVARRLHVSPHRLSAAIKSAFIDRLNAAVKAGRLSEAQANMLKRRIEQGLTPPFLFGPGFGAGPHFLEGPPAFGLLDAAASYLGLSATQLFHDLRAGHSLAQIAKSRGKSASGLERAMITSIKSRLDQTVAAGRLTKSQEQQVLSRLLEQDRRGDQRHTASSRDLACSSTRPLETRRSSASALSSWTTKNRGARI